MKGVIFRNVEGNQEYLIPVIDKYPDWDIDVDGKWVVEVSFPMFIELAALKGLYPVQKETENGED